MSVPVTQATKISSESRRRGCPRLGSVAILAACLLIAAKSFAQDTVQTLTVTRAPVAGSPPVTQSFIVSEAISPPAIPTSVLILLPGGDGTINLVTTAAASPITATSVATNVLTVTVSNSNLKVGESVSIQGTAESFLNGQTVTIASLIGSTGFTANFAATNYTNASDTGTVSSFGVSINSNNFLIRDRWLFAGQSFYVISLDSATDFQLLPNGLTDEQGSAAHITDVLQVIAWARSATGLPVWVVGTSRGTGGAFAAGLNPPPTGPDGLVFADSIDSTTDPDSLLMANLAGIVVPVFFLNDAGNTCPGTLGGKSLTPVVKQLTSAPLVNGESVPSAGLAALTDNCKSLSDHGFFGKEDLAVEKIADWIRSAP